MTWLFELFRRRTLGKARGPGWSKARRDHLKREPVCQISGKKILLQVHHIKPFHKFPWLETDPDNLMTLTWWHHFWFAHLGNWRSINDDLLEWVKKVKNR